MCLITPSWDTARGCSKCLEDVKSDQSCKDTELPKASVWGCAKEPPGITGHRVQHMMTAWKPRFWEPVAAGACLCGAAGRSSTAHCTTFHQVFENTFNTLVQEICQERANTPVIYRPSYGLPYYCLESIRVGIYVLLWPFLPVQRTQTLWFSADLPVYSLLGRQE